MIKLKTKRYIKKHQQTTKKVYPSRVFNFKVYKQKRIVFVRIPTRSIFMELMLFSSHSIKIITSNLIIKSKNIPVWSDYISDQKIHKTYRRIVTLIYHYTAVTRVPKSTWILVVFKIMLKQSKFWNIFHMFYITYALKNS